MSSSLNKEEKCPWRLCYSILLCCIHSIWQCQRDCLLWALVCEKTPFGNYALNSLVRDCFLTGTRETFSETAAVITEHRYQPCPAIPLKQSVSLLKSTLIILCEQNSPMWNGAHYYETTSLCLLHFGGRLPIDTDRYFILPVKWHLVIVSYIV